MAEFVYLDETGSSRGSLAKSPCIKLVAVIVHEDSVRRLSESLNAITWRFLGWRPADFEFHGQEIWQRSNYWARLDYDKALAAYEAAISIVDQLDLTIAHATIDRAKLNSKYDGKFDSNCYLLALQFLLEKIDRLGMTNRVVVADRINEQELRAVKLVSDMQNWSIGIVPTARLTSVIDSLHFVRSVDSPGVQMADLVAFVLHRRSRGSEVHPEADQSLNRMVDVISRHTRTWRSDWPS